MRSSINKKGSSHVGFILSFTIFILFVVFMFTIIEPLDKRKNEKDFVLEHLKTVLVEDMSSDLTTGSVKIIDGVDLDDGGVPVPGSCDFFEIEKNSEGEVIIENSENPNYALDLDKIKIEWDNSWIGEGRFFRIYYSDKFSNSYTTPSGTICVDNPSLYTIGPSRTQQLIFMEEANRLKGEREDSNSYLALKEKYNIPDGNEFTFDFTYEDISGTSQSISPDNIQIPDSLEVFSEKIPIQYVTGYDNIPYKVKVETGFL